MLLVSYLYNLSERQVEELANDSLSVKYFLGLAVDDKVPDHSTLMVFKERLLRGGEKVYKELFQEIVRVVKSRRIKFGRVQVVDSSHVVADVDVAQEQKRKRGGKTPRDGGARWGVSLQDPVGKGSKVMLEEGKKVKKPRYFYGYKQHVSLNADNGLITAVLRTPGNAPDGKYLEMLVERDEKVKVETEVYAADRGYDDAENHLLLWDRGLKSAISFPYRIP